MAFRSGRKTSRMGVKARGRQERDARLRRSGRGIGMPSATRNAGAGAPRAGSGSPRGRGRCRGTGGDAAAARTRARAGGRQPTVDAGRTMRRRMGRGGDSRIIGAVLRKIVPASVRQSTIQVGQARDEAGIISKRPLLPRLVHGPQLYPELRVDRDSRAGSCAEMAHECSEIGAFERNPLPDMDLGQATVVHEYR